MSPVILAILVLCGVGAVCALLLVVASKYMAVPVDEKFPALRECLPGANCGACGYAGCDGYANALASGEETKTNKCIPGADAVGKMLSDALGVEFEDVVEHASIVCCRGNCEVTAKKAEFQGAKSCAAAKLLFGGDGVCQYACLGYGDCIAVCPEGGIKIVDGIAEIDAAHCVGCGVCVKVCPQHVIACLPTVTPAKVLCSSRDKGAAVTKKCSAGCIGCGLCVKKCPAEAIHLENNLAVIDYEKCTGCGTCKEVCPKKCIV